MNRHQTEWEALSDEELMVAYQQGKYEAFEMLYSRYANRIYGYLRKKIGDQRNTEDLFQATFQKLHASRSKYISSLPFKAWIFTLCRNTLIDFFRKRGRTKEIGVPEYGEALLFQDAQKDASSDIEISHVADLPKSQREALELRYYQDLSFDEIAHRLETSSQNARQLVSRAVRHLRKLLTSR